MKPQLLHNANIVTGSGTFTGYILIDTDGMIAAVVSGTPAPGLVATTDATDCGGDMLMPGVIDTHVHFRDPGLTEKGDIASESRAAVAGGVTTFFDMPNTRPATVTPEAWEQKMGHAAEASYANYAFFIGATNDNLDLILSLDYSRIPGIKLFLGSSTGNMLVDNDEALERLFASAPAIIAVHAEDESTINRARKELMARFEGAPVPVTLHSTLRPAEACIKAAKRAIGLARRHGTKLHLLHLSTAAELSLVNDADKNISLETCPHYLFFTEDDMQALGSRIKCNPAIKTAADREALLKAATDGTITTIATDHAPHLPADKAGDLFKAASGMPGIQFSLPLMLSHFRHDPSRLVELMAENPARLFGIEKRGFLKPGFHADIIRIKTERHIISDEEVISKCRWTPYVDMAVYHRVYTTWINGRRVWDKGEITGNPVGQAVTFKQSFS